MHFLWEILWEIFKICKSSVENAAVNAAGNVVATKVNCVTSFDFLEIGPGWDISFAPDFAEFTFYRLSELSLSDKRKYWVGGTAGFVSGIGITLRGKVPK